MSSKRKWRRRIEERLAVLEAAAPLVDPPPALDIELPAHCPLVDHRPPELLGSWYEEDEEDWCHGPRTRWAWIGEHGEERVRRDPPSGFGCYL